MAHDALSIGVRNALEATRTLQAIRRRLRFMPGERAGDRRRRTSVVAGRSPSLVRAGQARRHCCSALPASSLPTPVWCDGSATRRRGAACCTPALSQPAARRAVPRRRVVDPSRRRRRRRGGAHRTVDRGVARRCRRDQLARRVLARTLAGRSVTLCNGRVVSHGVLRSRRRARVFVNARSTRLAFTHLLVQRVDASVTHPVRRQSRSSLHVVPPKPGRRRASFGCSTR